MPSLAATEDSRRPQPVAAPLRGRILTHDLKNLMSVILSATETLVSVEGGDAGRRALAEASLEAARRGACVLRELLAEIDPEPQAPTSQTSAPQTWGPVDCAEALHATARLAPHVLPDQVTLSVKLRRSALHCRVDRRALEAALINLCKNAGEACAAGGVVSLSMAGVDPTAAEAAGLEPRAFVCFQVRDTGSGLAPEAVARLLTPGFTTKADGHGLGLASVAEFARTEGGGFRISAASGGGVCASLYLPRCAAGDAAPGVA